MQRNNTSSCWCEKKVGEEDKKSKELICPSRFDWGSPSIQTPKQPYHVARHVNFCRTMAEDLDGPFIFS